MCHLFHLCGILLCAANVTTVQICTTVVLTRLLPVHATRSAILTLLQRHSGVTQLKLKYLHFTMIPFGKFGPPYLGKATATARAALPMQSYKCTLGLFCVSVIHRTLTSWTTGSLTCVDLRDHSYACVYTCSCVCEKARIES